MAKEKNPLSSTYRGSYSFRGFPLSVAVVDLNTTLDRLVGSHAVGASYLTFNNTNDYICIFSI